jgi:hypothetical protein
MSRVTVFSLFSGADLVGEFDMREEAERALDEAVAAGSVGRRRVRRHRVRRERRARRGADHTRPSLIPARLQRATRTPLAKLNRGFPAVSVSFRPFPPNA